MRFHVVALLALCLALGLSAEPQNRLRERLGNTRERMNTARERTGAAFNAAGDAMRRAGNAVTSAGKNLVDNVKNLNREQIAEALRNFDMLQMIDTIENAANRMDELVMRTMDRIEDMMLRSEERASEALIKRAAEKSPRLQSALTRAQAAGADLSSCSRDNVMGLGRSASSEVVMCATDAIRAMTGISRRAIEMTREMSSMVKESREVVEECKSVRGVISRNKCRKERLTPMAKKCLAMVGRATLLYTQAAAVYTGAILELDTCAYVIAANKGVEAASMSTVVLACVTDKIGERNEHVKRIGEKLRVNDIADVGARIGAASDQLLTLYQVGKRVYNGNAKFEEVADAIDATGKLMSGSNGRIGEIGQTMSDGANLAKKAKAGELAVGEAVALTGNVLSRREGRVGEIGKKMVAGAGLADKAMNGQLGMADVVALARARGGQAGNLAGLAGAALNGNAEGGLAGMAAGMAGQALAGRGGLAGLAGRALNAQRGGQQGGQQQGGLAGMAANMAGQALAGQQQQGGLAGMAAGMAGRALAGRRS